MQVSAMSSVSRGVISGSVSGSMSAEQALARLLAGTGLSYQLTSGRTVVITRTGGEKPSDAPPADGSLVLDPIDVTARRGANAEDAAYVTPGSSSYISAEKIDRFRGTSPGDFLEGNPGVLVGAKRTSGAVDVNIRGMQGMDRVPVTVDGAQQANTVYRGYAGVASRSYIDPDFIGGVTVEKGPSLASDGAGATGGVVRMSTINADDILLDGKDYGVRVRGGAVGNSTRPPAHGTRGGINGSLLDKTYDPGALPSSFAFTDGLNRPSLLDPNSGFGSLTAAARNDRFEVVAGAARRKLGNYYAGKKGDDGGRAVNVVQPDGTVRPTLGGLTHFQPGEEVLNTSNDSESYLLKGVLKLDGGHRLELAYTKYLSTYYEMFPSQVIWFGGPFQEAPSKTDLDTYTATYTWKPEDNDLIDLRVNLWRSDVNFDIAQTTPIALLGNALWVTNTGVDATRWGANVSNASRFDTSFGAWKFDYGFSYTDEDMTQIRTTEPLPPYFPDPVKYPGKAGDRQEWSAFGSAQWRPLHWLTLDAGLRYTSTKTHDDCVYEIDNICKDTSNDGFAPITAVTVEPWKGVQFYGRYAEAIRSPSLYEATRGESFTVSPFFDLVPEHAKNWEFGMNVLRNDVLLEGDKFRFKAAYFDNDIKDYITRTYGGDTSGVFTLRNIERARFKGVELSAGYDTGRYFAEANFTRYLKTQFCLTAAEAAELGETRCNEGGVNAGYAQLHVPPEKTAALTLGARFFEEKVTLGGRVTYVSGRPVEGVNGGSGTGWTTLTSWRNYALVDLFTSWKVNDHLLAELNVDNLTDRYYVDALAVGLVPAPGRTVRAALTAKF